MLRKSKSRLIMDRIRNQLRIHWSWLKTLENYNEVANYIDAWIKQVMYSKPKIKYRRLVKKFRILNNLDKAEILFKAIHRFDSGTTASELARKLNTYPDWIRKCLNIFVHRRLIKAWNIGRFRFYAPKKELKGLNIRKFLEDEYLKDRNKENVKEAVGATGNRV